MKTDWKILLAVAIVPALMPFWWPGNFYHVGSWWPWPQ